MSNSRKKRPNSVFDLIENKNLMDFPTADEKIDIPIELTCVHSTDAEQDNFNMFPTRKFMINEHTSIVYSMYSVMGKMLKEDNSIKEMNCVIIIMDKNSMAIGTFDSKKCIDYATIDNSQDFNNILYTSRVKEELLKWKTFLDDADFVMIRCDNSQKEKFFSDKKVHLPNSKYCAIPFNTGPPSEKSLQEAFEEILSIECHGPKSHFVKHMEHIARDIRDYESAHEDYHTETQSTSIAVKYPNIDNDFKLRIHEAVSLNNASNLTYLINNFEHKAELLKYLSSIHHKLGLQSFLHFAVKNNLHETVEVLLEVGCDPSVRDKDKKVPFEYCRSQPVKEVFREFIENCCVDYYWARTLYDDVDIDEKKANKPRRRQSD